MSKAAAVIVIVLVWAVSDLRAQPDSTPRAIETIETCQEFQRMWAEDAPSALEHAMAMAAGFVQGLERGGVVDDLLPVPPALLRSGALQPRRERATFVVGRLLGSCRANPTQTIAEALDGTVTDAREAFVEMLRLKEALRRRAPQFWPRPWPSPYPRYDPGCIPETGKGCDLFHLL